MADCGCPGAPWLFVRSRGPLTPRRLLLSSPPTLEWVLLGVPSRKTPTPGGPLLVRRGEVLPETGTVVLDTRPTLQGILGPNTCISRIEVKGDCMGRRGGPQHSEEKEGGTQGGPQHSEKEGGTQWDQGGPQQNEEGDNRRDQGGPQHSEKEEGTQRDQRGPQHSEKEGGTQRDQGGPQHSEKEGGTQEGQREEEGEPQQEQGNQRDQQRSQEEQRDEGAIQESGRGGPLQEEGLSWGGQLEGAPSSDSLFVGSFLDISVFPPDFHSPLVSSFARPALPLRLRVAPIDAESLVRSGRLQEVGGPVDRSSALWVSRKQLRVLGFYHREWVWVSLPLDRGSTRKASAAYGHGGRHLAMILAAELWLGHPHKYNHLLSSPCLATRDEPTYPGSVPAGTAVISATLAFNLTSGVGCVSEVLIQRFSAEPTQEGRSALLEPPVATLLHIDVVKSPAYSSDATFQQALYQHFQTPRAVQLGDVLCVSSLSHSEFQLNKSQVPVRCPDLYFKVRKIEGEQDSEGYLANTTHTTLYQVGSVCSFVPSFPSRDGHVFWSSLFPAGLSYAVDDICRILLPHLQNTSDILEAGGRILLTGPKGCGKITVVQAACSRMNLHLYQVECARLCRDSSASTISRLRSVFSRAQDCQPCILLLCHLDLLGKDKDGSGEDARVLSALCSLLLGTSPTNRDLPFLVVATTSRVQEVPVDLQSCFLHEVSLSAPTEEQRLSLLTALTSPLPLSRDVDLAHLARRTAGFVVGDLCALLSRAGRISCTRIRNSCAPSAEDEEGLLAAGFPVTSQDLDCALADLQAAHSEAIGAPKVPCVRWSDVGGLEDAKRQLLDTVQFPLEHPEMLALGLSRSGILLYGPPGTGKTLLAKAVATECAMTFLSVKGPELINMYVGQSEENVREVFSRAQAASPCIIFFDELDSLAPNRGRSGDSGGVMDRVVSQLLAEMDGLHSSSDVFVIGATNRPDLLDPALLRPGRFDRLVYVGLNEDRESQQKVLEAITRKFSLHPAVDLSHVLQYCPAALTGADLYALCANAMMSSIKEKVQRLQEGADEPVTELVLRLEHLVQAAQHLQPSVSPQELQRYERIHRQFSMTSDDV